MKVSNKDFFSKCDQIRSFLRIWSHLLKKYLMENFIFVLCYIYQYLRGFVQKKPPEVFCKKVFLEIGDRCSQEIGVLLWILRYF